ncbi:MAG: type II toxin-antitoxin system RelE/ParE family toxin [Kiritimatiellae bacterium]|nr:type II toxin-antitoxin system RelE/ParE family toxin [Kiritimatiellia bacterium]
MSDYRVNLRQEAWDDLARMRRFDQLQITDALDTYLATAPCRQSRSRIKRILSPRFSGYRLRVGPWRAYYTVQGRRVDVARILPKEAGRRWLNPRRIRLLHTAPLPAGP